MYVVQVDQGIDKTSGILGHLTDVFKARVVAGGLLLDTQSTGKNHEEVLSGDVAVGVEGRGSGAVHNVRSHHMGHIVRIPAAGIHVSKIADVGGVSQLQQTSENGCGLRTGNELIGSKHIVPNALQDALIRPPVDGVSGPEILRNI